MYTLKGGVYMAYTDMITKALDSIVDMKNGVSAKALKKRCRHNSLFSTLRESHLDKGMVLPMEVTKKIKVLENEARVRLQNYLRFVEITELLKDGKLNTSKKIEQVLAPFVSKLDEVEREVYQYVLGQPATSKPKKQEVEEIIVEPEQESETILISTALEE